MVGLLCWWDVLSLIAMDKSVISPWTEPTCDKIGSEH